MPWISFESTSSIVLNIVGGFLAGIALLLVQSGWKVFNHWRDRRAAVTNTRKFFRDWESANEANAHEKAFRFYYHETMIRRMKENLTIYRYYLSARQWSELAELIQHHEDFIDGRRKLVLAEMDPPVPDHFALLPEHYQEFFDQAKAIKWLRL